MEEWPNAEAWWWPTYSPWRHGGYYVTNLHYPSGAVGCVSNNFTDRRWRVVCEGGKYDTLEEYPSYDSRDQAAFAEREIVRGMSN